MKKSIEKKLTNDEFTLICDSKNGTITKVESDSTFWENNLKYNFILGIYEVNEDNNLEEKYNVNIDALANKLYEYTYKEFLELLVQIDIFWGNDEEFYLSFRYLSPFSVLKPILENLKLDLKLSDVPYGIKFRIDGDGLFERTHLKEKDNMMGLINSNGEIIWFSKNTIINSN